MPVKLILIFYSASVLGDIFYIGCWKKKWDRATDFLIRDILGVGFLFLWWLTIWPFWVRWGIF